MSRGRPTEPAYATRLITPSTRGLDASLRFTDAGARRAAIKPRPTLAAGPSEKRGSARARAPRLLPLSLLCQVIDGWGCPELGRAAWSRRQTRRARWRLRQRIASRLLLPSARRLA